MNLIVTFFYLLAYNKLEPIKIKNMNTQKKIPVEKRFETFSEVQTRIEPSVLTGNSTLDNWWSKSGGIVIGSSIFLTGTSGAGKTTLAVFLMKILNEYKTALWSREMPRADVKEQTNRMNVNHSNALIADDDTCPTFEQFIEALDHHKPKFVIVDSLQVVAKGVEFSENGESDVQFEIIQTLRKWIKENDAVLFMIGHNKKDGEFRGDNTIMQMFDAHIEMIHHKKGDFRTIAWGQKNRKGPLGMLYYEFVDSELAIEFFTEDEWKIIKKGTSITDMVNSTLESYINAYSNNKNYKVFRKEFIKLYNEICKTSSTELEALTRVIPVISELSIKYFGAN